MFQKMLLFFVLLCTVASAAALAAALAAAFSFAPVSYDLDHDERDHNSKNDYDRYVYPVHV